MSQAIFQTNVKITMTNFRFILVNIIIYDQIKFLLKKVHACFFKKKFQIYNRCKDSISNIIAINSDLVLMHKWLKKSKQTCCLSFLANFVNSNIFVSESEEKII